MGNAKSPLALFSPFRLGYTFGGSLPIVVSTYTENPFEANATASVGERWIAGPIVIRVPAKLGTIGYAGEKFIDVSGSITADGVVTATDPAAVVEAIEDGGWLVGEAPSLEVLGAEAEKAVVYRDFTRSGTATVSRAGTGTFFNAAGLIETAAANVARYDYSRGGVRALLLESTATNPALYSNVAALMQINWFESGGPGNIPAVETAIRGVPARSFTRRNANFCDAGLGPTYTVTPGAQHTFSFWAASPNGAAIKPAIRDVTNGTWVLGHTTTNTVVTLTPNGLRYSYPFTVPAGCTQLQCKTDYGTTGKLGDTVAVTLPQFEAGNVASSSIITGATAATRAADSASIDLPAGTYDRRVVTADGTVDTPAVVHPGGPIALPMGLLRSVAYFATAAVASGPTIDVLSIARVGINGTSSSTLTYVDVPVAAAGETIAAFEVHRGPGNFHGTLVPTLEGANMAKPASASDQSGVGLQRAGVRTIANAGTLTDRTLVVTGISASTTARGTAVLMSGSDMDEYVLASVSATDGTTSASTTVDVQAGDVLIAILDRTGTDFGALTWAGLTQLSPSTIMGNVSGYSAVARADITADDPAYAVGAAWATGGNNQFLAILRLRKTGA